MFAFPAPLAAVAGAAAFAPAPASHAVHGTVARDALKCDAAEAQLRALAAMRVEGFRAARADGPGRATGDTGTARLRVIAADAPGGCAVVVFAAGREPGEPGRLVEAMRRRLPTVGVGPLPAGGTAFQRAPLVGFAPPRIDVAAGPAPAAGVKPAGQTAFRALGLNVGDVSDDFVIGGAPRAGVAALVALPDGAVALVAGLAEADGGRAARALLEQAGR